MKICLSVIIYISAGITFSQLSIGDWLKLIEFRPENFIHADRPFYITTFDSSGYYFSYTSESENEIMCEGKVFSNSNKSSMLIISSIEEDEQCYRYHTRCFIQNPDSGKYTEIAVDSLFVDPDKFLMSEENAKLVNTIIEKYLPQIRNEYLGQDAEFKDVYQEFYDLRIILSGKKNEIGTTLTVCDYIPRNAVGIDSTDWSIIQNAPEINIFKYSASKRMFIRR